MADEAEGLDLEHEAETEEHAPESGGEDTQPAAFDPEAVARLAGWAPREEWRGDPADWKDASTFLIDTAVVNKSLRKDVKELRTTVERTARTAERIMEAERVKAMEEARRELRAAVQAGDEDAADAAAQRIEQVGRQPAQSDASPIDAFAQENPWFGIHAAATGLAQTEAEKIFRKGGSVDEQLAAGRAAVQRRFPELFDEGVEPAQRQQRAAPPVQGGQRSPRAPPRKGYAALPPEAKKAAEQFQRITKGRVTLEDYARTYHEENA
jgi:ElaB/YqjD/DUF883 family membrane-anchored ribosome-binding protein